MKKRLFTIALLCFLLNLFALEYVPNEIIIKTKKHRNLRGNSLGLKGLDTYLHNNKVKKIRPILKKSDNRYYVAVLDKNIDKSELESLHFKDVEYVQPNYINTMFNTPNDPEFVHQRFYDINAPLAWDYTQGNRNVIVGLVDSGLHLNHPDLQENIYVNQKEAILDDGTNLDYNSDGYISWKEIVMYMNDHSLDLNNDGVINGTDVLSDGSPFLNGVDDDGNGYIDDIAGWDFVDAPELSAVALGDYVNPDNNPEDENNHGTHVGGIIAADSDNGIGVAGTNWHAKILAVRAGFKTIQSQGYLQDDDAAAGVIYAVDMGADVINASWGDYVYSQIIADACQYAYEKGCIMCVSSGNTGKAGVMYPAKLSSTIAVGAMNQEGDVANLTSWGPELDVIAPGINIISTFTDGSGSLPLYEYQSGTSMASPFVSGAVSLLLSIQPNLNFEQVKAKLYETSKDVGEPGFDSHSGAGALDVYKLIMDTNAPYIEVTSPSSYQPMSSTFNIMGSVNTPDFFEYSVMFSDEETPSSTDWYNVSYPHINRPKYYFNPVIDDTIATFEVDESILDGDYKVKIEVISTTAEHYSYLLNINIDTTPPVIQDSLTFIQKRYDSEKLKYFVKVTTDEPSYIKVNCSNGTDNYEAYSNIISSTQSILLPQMNDGNYSIHIQATNKAGYSSDYDFPNLYRISNSSVDIHSYSQKVIGNEKIFLKKTADFDNNGKNDFIAALPLSSTGNSSLGFYEVEGDDIVLKREFDYPIYPQSIGDTDGNGMELIGKNIDGNGSHYENTHNSFYPDYLFHTYDYSADLRYSYYSGNFIEFNNDDFDDIAIKTRGNLIKLYTREHQNVTEVTQLLDNTPYNDQTNVFALNVSSGNLDRFGGKDILTTDSDGDIMIYEYSDHADTLLLPVWSARVGVPNLFNSAIGNFRTNTFHTPQFCVGGYYKDFLDPANSYSYFLFFETDGNDNSYVPFGSIGFTNVNPPNYIAAADIDGDGDDELIALVTPNIYIIDYVNGEFVPVWKGEADARNSNAFAVIPQTETENAAILVNIAEGDSLKSTLIQKAEEFTGPDTPSNFDAFVTREGKVQLSWEREQNSNFYKIYKRKIHHEYAVYDSVMTNEYLDENVELGDTLYYKVTVFSNLYHPNESLATSDIMVIVGEQPNLDEIKMDSANTLKLIFDNRLSNTSFSVGNFLVNNGYNYPISINQIANQHGVLLTFVESFKSVDEEAIEPYTIKISNVKTAEGVDFYYGHDNVVPFEYSIDVVAPYIENITVNSKDSFSVEFSESMEASGVEDLSNYHLLAPLCDKGIEIKSLNYSSEAKTVTVYLNEKANKSNQMFMLRLNNVYDLAGNKITNDGDKYSFLMNPITTLSQMIVGPNPFNMSKYEILKFFLPTDKKGHIKIINMNGEMVYESDIEPLSDLNNFYTWNGKNFSGNDVASGIYFYLIKMGSKYQKGKFTVIK